MIVTLEMAYSNLFAKGMRRTVAQDFISHQRAVILWSCPMDRHALMRELREILIRLLVGLAVFLIAVTIYKHSDPYAYPGLEGRILYALAPAGIVILYLYFSDSDVCSRLLRAGGVTGVLRDNRYTRVCNDLWQSVPSPVRMVASFCIQYGFIVLLLLVVVHSVAPDTIPDWVDAHLMTATVLFGAVTFYLNRGKLADIEEETRREAIAEKRRDAEFAERYQWVNRVWGLRRVVRWGYKEGWWYGGGLMLIVLVGFGLRIWNLGRLGLTFDEGVGWAVVEGILGTGLPMLPSGNMYLRGLPYLYLNALIASVFGTSEFTLRIVSVMAGTGSIILFFLIGKKAGVEKYLLLCGSALLSFHYWTITMSRWGRMYIFTVFFILLTLYFFLKLIDNITNKNHLLFCIAGSVSILSHNTGNVVFLYIISYFLVSFLSRKNIIDVVLENIKIILSFIVLCSVKVLSTLLFQIGNIDTSTGSGNRTLLESLIRSLHLSAFKFNNYLFIQDQFGVLIISVILAAVCAIAILKIWRMEKALILTISLLTFIITLFGTELHGGRIVFFQLFIYLLSFVIIIQDVSRKRVTRFLVLLIFLILLLPNTGFGIPIVNYGSKTVPQYSPSNVIDFYPDNKNPSIEVSRLARENDTVLFYGLPMRSYPYLGEVLTYKNFYRISKKRLGRNTLNRDIYTNTTIIYDYTNLVEIIDNSEGDVYLVTTFSVLSYSLQQPYLYHFRPSMLNNVLHKYQTELLFRSDDGVSSLYLVSQTQLQKNQSELR